MPDLMDRALNDAKFHVRWKLFSKPCIIKTQVDPCRSLVGSEDAGNDIVKTKLVNFVVLR